MIIITLIAALSVIIAAISKAVRDSLSHHFERSVFNKLNPYFWDPVLSGANKWKDGKEENGEKFFLSSTLLVGVTEGWHVFESLNTFFIFLGVGLSGYTYGILGMILARVLYGIAFTISYEKFKLK